MTKLTTGLAQELYDKYYIGESRSPGWIAEANGVTAPTLVTLWNDMGLQIRDRSESQIAKHMTGKPWSWDYTGKASQNGASVPAVVAAPPATTPAVQGDGVPVHEISIPADGLPVRLRLTVGNVRLEIEVGE